MKKCFILIGILLIPLSVFAWENYMDKSIKSWLGYPLEALIEQWGYPDEEKFIAGKKLYVWMDYDYDTNTNSGGISISSTDKKGRESVFSVGGDAVVNYCQKVIEVNDNNIIINGRWKGNNCPILYGGKKLMNQKNKL